MSRYKDVDEILEAMDTWPKYGCKPDGRFIELTKETEADYVPYVHYDDMVQAVTGTPVQDVAPVVHAHWIELYDPISYVSIGYEYVPKIIINCSNCNNEVEVKTPYCPNCGAKMDEEVNK